MSRACPAAVFTEESPSLDLEKKVTLERRCASGIGRDPERGSRSPELMCYDLPTFSGLR